MDHQVERILIEKYLNGEATPEEIEKIDQWYIKHAREISDALPEPDYEEAETSMWLAIKARNKPATKIFAYLRIASIAAAVLVVLSGIWYFRQLDKPYSGPVSANHDVAPGKNVATITLANGENIQLSDSKTGVIVGKSKLAYNDGTTIKDPALDQIGKEGNGARVETITTPRGGTYRITLSDGTNVWLNAASSLTYSTTLTQLGERRVTLVGEAYFEVSKDKNHPFIVKTGEQDVEVLGTHFNINSYSDENAVRTTLLEGAVRVVQNKQLLRLNPGEQAETTVGGTLKLVKDADIDAAIAWKNGTFYFANADVQTVMRQISRWYDIDVVYEGSIPKRSFEGQIQRNLKLSQVLRILEKNKLNFYMDGKKIIVK